MWVCGAGIRTYYILSSKTYSQFGSLFWIPPLVHDRLLGAPAFVKLADWKYVNIGSDNGLAPLKRQTIVVYWCNYVSIILDEIIMCLLMPWFLMLLSHRHAWTWWSRQMITFSALMALCEENSLVTGGFPSHKPVIRSFDVFFDLRQNKLFIKQSRCQWFEMPSSSLWRHSNEIAYVGRTCFVFLGSLLPILWKI